MEYYNPAQHDKKRVATEQKTETREIKQAPAKPLQTTAITMAVAAGAAKEETTKLTTNEYDVTLTNRGASLSQITYKARKVDLAINQSQYQARGVFDFPIHFSEDEFLDGNALDALTWQSQNINPETVRYYTSIALNGNPMLVEKIFTFNKKDQSFLVEYRLTNNGRGDAVLNDNKLTISPSDLIGPNLDFNNTYNQISGVIYSLNGKFKKETKSGSGDGFGALIGCSSPSQADAYKIDSGTVDWFGIMGRYFVVIMIPEKSVKGSVMYDNRKGTGYRIGVTIPVKPIKPGGKFSQNFKIYLGEKDKDKLTAVDKRIVDAADISTLIEPIRYFVMWCLMGINSFIGNIGWSLVIFSILSKIAFTPLTLKSNESMRKMQQLTPHLNKLKEKFKDKPDVMQKEMMKLYKEHKVNPMGGCLPLLLQMQFFFGLYSALINSLDLWNAPFMLWIKDLSMPDTVAVIFGYNINILPLFMTATTFLQQKLSTVDSGNQQQKMMMMMMPVILIFVFWNMPSGLVLYWTLQNVFQILHQLYINKFSKDKKENAEVTKSSK
jgi:YidC/Oxa1 family membrane protein insertase